MLTENSPGVFIPCQTLKNLQQLMYLLYEKEILQDDDLFILKNTPKNMIDILNSPEYFETSNIMGIISGNEYQLKEFIKVTETLL
jgi:hypothetical protein